MDGKDAERWSFGEGGLPALIAFLRPHAAALALALALMLVQSVATLLQPWFGGVLTNRLVLGQGFGTLLWMLFGLVCAQALVGYLVSIQLQQVSGRIMRDLGVQLYAHLQSLPLAWHQERRRGDTLALLTGDAYRLGEYLTGTLLPLLPLLVTFLGALAMMFDLSPLIAGAVAVLLPLMFLLLKIVGRRLRPLGHASMQAWADQSALAEQNLELLPLIRMSATERLESARYRDRAEALYRATLREARLQGAISPAVHVAGAGLVLGLLGVAGHLIIREEMNVGTMVSVFLYGLVLVNPVSQLANVYGATQVARGAWQRLRDALGARPEEDPGTLDTVPAEGDIEFRSVDFSYPGREPLFVGLDFRIRAGETIGLTGANGAGKSTLVHLLLRLIEPQAGQLTFDGIDARAFKLEALRRHFGIVPQQVMLFNASVAENIAYGRVDASRAEIERAAHAARAEEFVAALPNGYETIIGDQGIKLSGGQKQRLALARALLRDPPVLIFDEATSMFDPAGESEFIAECRELLRRKTVILITHRPASLALADRVVRIEQGKPIELFDASRG